jgi:aminodeoxyfutalosine deaminase
VLPIEASPIRDGWVDACDGRIVAFGAGPPGAAVDLGRVAILPALVNAHTHLELSFLRGRVPPSTTFLEWVRTLLRVRREAAAVDPARIVGAAAAAIVEACSSGTGVFGDVANTTATVPLLKAAGVSARVFFEILGFNASDPSALVRAARTTIEAAARHAGAALPAPAAARLSDRVSVSLAPHAPYSVSPALFQSIRADLDAHPDNRTTVHLGESPEEVEFLRTGTGPWRALLGELGVWNDTWCPPATSPARYLNDLGFLGPRVAAVHGVQFTAGDVAVLRARNTAVIVCPRSNRHVGVGLPPLASFYDAGLRVAVGTDSLASVDDLNLFTELAEMRRAAPTVSARRLLESATATGAHVLGLDADHGTLRPGTRADLIAVAVPEGIEDVEDVEEYLVSGLTPDRVSWVTAFDDGLHARGVRA